MLSKNKPANLKVTTLIVLYKSTIGDSTSVISLLKCSLTDIKLKLVIWNNGPAYLTLDDVTAFEKKMQQKKITFEIYQDIRNISLSHLYNFCISKNIRSDFFTILDQDSVISSDFFTNLVRNSNYDLILPKAYHVEKPTSQISPRNTTKDIFDLTLPERELDPAKIFAISSGLSFSNSLIARLISKYGSPFCEDYVFYHVDGDLFERLQSIGDVNAYLCGSILHSVSKQSEHQKLEMGYFQIIKRRKSHKNVLQQIRFSCHLAIADRCTFTTLLKFIKCAIVKQHPRYKFRINSDFKADYSSNK